MRQQKSFYFIFMAVHN